MVNEKWFLLDEFDSPAGPDSAKHQISELLHARRVRTKDEIPRTVRDSDGSEDWIALRGRFVPELVKASAMMRRQFRCLVVLEGLSENTRLVACNLFRQVIISSSSFLPWEELQEVLTAGNRADLFIGGIVDQDSEVIALFRGDLSKLLVPFAAFRENGGVDPDFTRFNVIDYGHTLKFGDYEAAADAVLYDFDSDYRKRMIQNLKNSAKGFGPSLRRLRKQRRLRRSDFLPLNEKTIARIERGEVERPEGETLKILSSVLGVPIDEIETY